MIINTSLCIYLNSYDTFMHRVRHLRHKEIPTFSTPRSSFSLHLTLSLSHLSQLCHSNYDKLKTCFTTVTHLCTYPITCDQESALLFSSSFSLLSPCSITWGHSSIQLSLLLWRLKQSPFSYNVDEFIYCTLRFETIQRECTIKYK